MKITIRTIDDELTYTVAPAVITQAIKRRLEDTKLVVEHPTEPLVYIVDPHNFWDGPTHVTFEPDTGHFHFDGWGGESWWPLIGPIG